MPSAIDAAVVDHHDVVGEAVGLFEVLRREQHGRAVGDELLDHAPEVGATRGVEAGRGLVEEEHRRPVHERGREVEPAAHPAGVGLAGPVGRVGEVERSSSSSARAPATRLGQVA